MPACLLLILALAACDAPNYTPVREWASTASLAVDIGRGALRQPPADTEACTRGDRQRGVAAMQEALATYLSAIGILADDGVLPYRENPFLELGPHAAAADAQGGWAVASLGTMLRHATRTNAQAPQLRYTIAQSDPMVQALVVALSTALMQHGPEDQAAGDPATRAQYLRVLARVGEGHAMLKARAGSITLDETVQRIRAAEGQLRLALAALPRPLPPLQPGLPECSG